MPENDRLDGCLNEIELGFVERKATPRLLMKLVFNSILLVYHFRTQYLFLTHSVSVALDSLFVIVFTRQSYSPNLVGARITSRLTKLCSDLIMSSIGCIPLSIPKQTNYCLQLLS